MWGLAALLAALLTATALHPAAALQLDAFDAGATWQLRALRFMGTGALPPRELRKVMVTRARPWFAPWRPWPPFDPIAFRADLERVRQLYRDRGYYRVRVTHELEPVLGAEALVAVVIVDEGPRVVVERVAVSLDGAPLSEPQRRQVFAGFPLVAGAPFTQEDYDRGVGHLLDWYGEHGFARVEVEKAADVWADRNAAVVRYAAHSGPATVFGEPHVVGVQRLDPEVVRDSIAFTPGRPFRKSRLEETRANLAELNLFRFVRVAEEPGTDPRVNVEVRVEELPPREIRLGVGYDTEEQIRGLASWRHYDFLGGARQLGVAVRASFLERSILTDFLQPHWPGRSNRFRLLFSQTREDEDPYDVDRTRGSPRLEWRASSRITGFVFYRFEYDALRDVNEGVRRALPGAAPRDGILSGFGIGADWNATDDLLYPTRGFFGRAAVEPVGGFLGGDFAFVRATVEGRGYFPIVRRLTGAVRLRLGAAQPTDGSNEVVLFERFHAGGLDSVRGYGRWRIGPLADDEPLGGRTLVETSVELRHPLTDTLGAAVFVDAGQVSLESFDFPFDDLQYGAGFGIRYRSPVGPLRVDLGFPAEPPPGDPHWRIHVMLGTTF